MASYTFLENIEAEVPIPEKGILSRAVFNDDALRVVAFAFSAGQELSTHTAPKAAVIYMVKGEAELTLGEEKKLARAGAWIHMPPDLPHGLLAKTPVILLLMLLKQ